MRNSSLYYVRRYYGKLKKYGINIFDDTERQIINQLSLSMGYDISLENLKKLLKDFCLQIDEDEKKFAATAEGLMEKIALLSDDGWESMKAYLPFHVKISAVDDYADGVLPEDEVR